MASSADPKDPQGQLAKELRDIIGKEQDAIKWLRENDWDVNTAADAFFHDRLTKDDRDTASGSRNSPSSPIPGSSSQPSQPTRQARSNRGEVRTLNDLASKDENEDDGDHRGARGDLFAGGEKSGLAVKDRDRDRDTWGRAAAQLVKNAQRAAAQQQRSAESGPSQSSYFSGSGQTLGGEGVPSRSVPSIHGNPIQRVGQYLPDQPPVQRTIHLWSNGFSLDDGPLHSSENDMNRQILDFLTNSADAYTEDGAVIPEELRRILGLRPHEMSEVRLEPHGNEKWRLVHPFAAEGRRLGSPVPGDGSPAMGSTIAPTSQASVASTAAAGSASAPTGLDESQPIITIRIQLPNGTRLPARFNTTQTVGDVYGFVQQSSPDTRSRNWVLATTFPNKEHVDRSTVLGEMDEFKRGGTAVVKWV